MMTLLSGLLTRAVGPWLSILTIPLLAIVCLVGWHSFAKEHDTRIAVAARNVCNSNWEADIRQQERDAALAQTQAAQRILTGERRINEDLHHELTQLYTDLETARAGSSDADIRCLSDGVLRAIGDSGSAPRPRSQSR